MGDFLFPPRRVNVPVSSALRRRTHRLLLARLFALPANLLVLDEPTNDLDIDSLEMLEQTLATYPGTIILVSHDRRFLDNVVTEVLAPEGNGLWREYVGGYSDWLSATSRTRRTCRTRRSAAQGRSQAAPARQQDSNELQGNAGARTPAQAH